MKTGWYFYFGISSKATRDVRYYCCTTHKNHHNMRVSDSVFLISYKRLPNINAYPDISCHVEDYADVLLGHGWGAYLIKLAGIPLNPLSMSEAWPESHLSGLNRPDIRFLVVVLFYWVKWWWFNCGISDGDIRAYNVLNSEFRASV